MKGLVLHLVVGTAHTEGQQIIAAGPLSKQPHSTPYRIVLVKRNIGGFTVHKEFFEDLPEGDGPYKSSLAEGKYFTSGGTEAELLAKATQAFGEMVASHSEYLLSLARL